MLFLEMKNVNIFYEIYLLLFNKVLLVAFILNAPRGAVIKIATTDIARIKSPEATPIDNGTAPIAA